MSPPKAGKFSGCVLFLGLQFLKEGNEGVGIIVGIPQVLSTQLIGFFLRFTGDSENGQGHSHPQGRVDSILGPVPATDEKGRKCGKLHQLTLRHPFRGVTGGHVSNFMSHHPRQFGFTLSLQDEPFVDVEVPPGQSEGVHVIRVNDFDDKGNLGIRVLHEVLGQSIDVFGDNRILNQTRGLFEIL